MTNPTRPPHAICSMSVTAYGLIVQAYPYAFRREFGASMTQVFGDSVREAWNRSGVAGVGTLWMRTIADVAVSLSKAYSSEQREPIFKFAMGTGVFYALALVLAIAYGAIRFGEYYQPPAFTRIAAPQAHEDALLTAYDQALVGKYGDYQTYAQGAGLLFSLWLGVAAGLFGLSQRSTLHGAVLLLAGIGATVCALSLLPTMWFPLDRYPVGALWLMGGLPLIGAAVWLLVTVMGRSIRGRTTPSAV